MRLPSSEKGGTNARLSSGSVGTVKRYESFVAHTKKHHGKNGHGGRLNSEEFKGRSSSGSGSRDDEESVTEKIIEEEVGETGADEILPSPSNVTLKHNKKKTLSLVEQRAAMFTEMEQKQFALPEIEVKGKRIESAPVKDDESDATNQNTEGAGPAESSAEKEKNNGKVTSRWVEQRAAVFDGSIQKNDDAQMQQTDEVKKPLKGTVGGPLECVEDEEMDDDTGLKMREHDGTNEVENNEDECMNGTSSSLINKIATPSPSNMDFQSKKNALINFASGGRNATNYGRNEIYDPNKSRVATQHEIQSDEGPTAKRESAWTRTITERESSDSSAPMRSPSPSRLDFASKKKAFLDFASSQQHGAYHWRKGASSHHNDTITSFAGRNADRNGRCPDDDGPSLSAFPKKSFNPPDDHIDEERSQDDGPSTEDDCGQPIPSNNETEECQDIIISIESIAEVSEEESETPEPSPTMAGFHCANIDFASPLLKPSEMHLGRLRKPDSWKSPMGEDNDERSPQGTNPPRSVSESTSSSHLKRRSSRPSMESEQTKSSDGDSLDHIIFPTSRNSSDFAAAGRKHDDGIQCDQDVRHFSSHFDHPWGDNDPTAIIDQDKDDNDDIDDNDDDNTASIAQLDSQAFEAEAIEFGMDLNAFQREIDMINAMTSPAKSTVTTPSAAAWSVGMHSFREDQGGNNGNSHRQNEIHDGDMTNYHRTVATPRSPMAQSPFVSPRYGRGSDVVVDQDVVATAVSDGVMDTAEVDATMHQAETKNEDAKNRFEMNQEKDIGYDRDVETEMHVGSEYPSKLQLFQESLSPKQRHIFHSIMEKRDLELKLLESQNRSKTVEVDLLKVELIDQHKQIQELLDQLTTLRNAADNDRRDAEAADGGCDHDDQDDCKENAPSKENFSMHRELIDLRAKLQASEAAVAQLRMQNSGEDRRDSTPKNGGSAKKSGGKKAKNNRSLKARVFGKQLYHA